MILKKVHAVIRERIRKGDPETSYVARLHRAGLETVIRKIGEEAIELVLAANTGSKKDVIHEAADLWFHTLVLLAERGVTSDEVLKELERRSGSSGIKKRHTKRSKK